VTFETASSGSDPQSAGEFIIDGFGTVPTSCHSSSGASCTLRICSSTVDISADTTDAWKFSVWIDGGLVRPTNWTTVSGGEHVEAPELLDTDQYDNRLVYGENASMLDIHALFFAFSPHNIFLPFSARLRFFGTNGVHRNNFCDEFGV
jgi:hypothetical protein